MHRVLIFTNLFPNPEQPLRGNFVASLVKEMEKEIDITVVSPLPWFPEINFLRSFSNQSLFARIPYFSHWNGFEVYYPKYPFIPFLSRPLQPTMMTYAVSDLVERLVEKKKIDVINAHWIYPDAISAVWIGKRTGIPVVVSARGCDINLYGTYKLRKPQIIWALRNSHKITTVSGALTRKIVKEFGICRKKVIVIPNGVDKNRFSVLENKKDAKKQLGLDQNKRFLIFVGQLHEVKGINYLIEALSILKKQGTMSFITVLVGDGPLKIDVLDWIREKNLTEDVILVEEKQNSEIPIWMNACDVLCLPSKREGLPNVILEATACGLPIVASKIGGIPELVKENNGILVEPQNPFALAGALETAFKRDWDSKMISKQAEDFTWRRSAELYLKIFDEIFIER